MSGVKGRSGRWPRELENLKQRAIEKAWNKINYKLGMSDAKSYDYARDMVVKDMTGHTENKNLNINEEKKAEIHNHYVELLKKRNLDIISSSTES